MDPDELLAQAMAILGTEPLPADAYNRIAALERQAPDDERWGRI